MFLFQDILNYCISTVQRKDMQRYGLQQKILQAMTTSPTCKQYSTLTSSAVFKRSNE